MTDPRFDPYFDALSKSHRRSILRRLRRDPIGTTTVDALVDHLFPVGRGANERGDRDSVEIALVHRDLPKLADVGVIEYDPDDRTVRYAGDERIETLLDAFPAEADEATP